MKYRILQMATLTNYAFMSYDFAIEHGFSLNDYKEVYVDTIPLSENIYDTLDQIFVIFNSSRPAGFKGHSLSVSDIIEIEDGRKFYVDSIGFKEIE